ncbi:RuvB-like protein 2 [Nematocida sp. AWRm77]|nr:RuvB-like protein 2 [Nematocida sp. AWRm77]
MIERIGSLPSIERIGAHTHIRGLGVSEDMSTIAETGLVGMHSQRKAMYLISKLVRDNIGRLVLLAGASGSGKSALCAALANDLKASGVPCTVITASEIYSSSLSKIEILTQAIRQTIGIEVKEHSKVLEGEVVEIKIDREVGKTGKITLKTIDTEGVFTLGDKMIQSLYMERVEPGDIVRINKTTGVVKKLGRSAVKAKEYESIGPNGHFLPCPEGELLRVQEEQHTVTFHEIDILNTKTQGYLSLLNVSTEIPSEIRDSVDGTMKEWVEEGRGTLKTGVLFINESHLLDVECYSFLNTISELKNSPTVILSTSQSTGVLRGTKEMSPFSLPADLLSRMLVVKTSPYTDDQIERIIQNRAEEEAVKLEEESVPVLVALAKEQGIRYALNILSASDALSCRTSKSVTPSMIASLTDIFISEARV